MKRTLVNASLLAAGLLSLSTQAADIEVSVTNLTHGNHFTPLLIAAHTSDSHLFHVGEMASPALQKMAEGGDIADLDTAVTGTNGVTSANPAMGLLAAGASAVLVEGWHAPAESRASAGARPAPRAARECA